MLGSAVLFLLRCGLKMLLDEHSKRGKRPNGHHLERQKVRLAEGQRFEERTGFLDSS
jgi:hypothetical protein